MQIYKTKGFARFARSERIADASLREAIERAERSWTLISAAASSNSVSPAKARRGLAAIAPIIAYRVKDRAVFLYAFAKKERENIERNELAELRRIGQNWLNAAEQTMEEAIDDGDLKEVDLDEEENEPVKRSHP